MVKEQVELGERLGAQLNCCPAQALFGDRPRTGSDAALGEHSPRGAQLPGKTTYRSEVAAQVVQPAESLPAGFAGIRPFSRVAPKVTLQVCLPLHHVSAKWALESHPRQVICE